MDTLFTTEEVRVLGALIEKALTTPEYYPLSLNALVNACNQKSNREPVVAYDDVTVARALESLRERGLIHAVTDGGRVPKYRHYFDEAFELTPPEVAILCELMLRGPQTAGELRAHAERLHPFASPAEVEEVLRRVMTREAGALAAQLPRQPGRKEPRYAHLLSGEPVAEETTPTARVEPAVAAVREEHARLARLEGEVADLRREVEALREEFRAFTAQFE